jgi:two-component system OmpR family sensor kinase
MSIRFRLTLLYSAILAFTLLGFGAALYGIQSATAHTTSATLLADTAQRLVTTRYFRLTQIDEPARHFAAPETYAQTRYADGTLASRTANLDGITLPLSADCLRTVQNGMSQVDIVPLADVRLMVYSTPVLAGGRMVGIVQVARSLEEQDQALQTLQHLLLIVGGVATVLACAMGWVLAGAALRPIDRLTDTARVIGAERDFDRRVAYGGTNDEVGRLATSFNTLLTALQAAYRQMEQSLQVQRRFVADASHELRTPLTVVRGNLGLLQHDPPISGTDRDAVLADMVDETERLIRLVNDLLALARFDTGRALRHEPIPIVPLIEEVCRQAQLLEPRRQIDCVEIPPVAIAGDRDALKQVLVILLDNARKYTPLAGRITIAAAASDGTIAVIVRDTGRGIEPAALPHIFERFYRGDSARTGAGAGLGLAIAEALVAAMGGQIMVESRVDEGSAFTVRLPQAPTAVPGVDNL